MEAAMLIWIIVAIVAAILEVLTTGLFLATMAVAAVATALVAPFLPGAIQVLLFAGLSLVGILAVRPLVVSALGLDSLMRHDQPVIRSHIVGRRAVVTRIVDASGGQIRIGEGEFWSARAYDSNERIPVGETVEVMLVDGLTALVTPLTTLPQTDVPELPSTASTANQKESNP
jgi:membrane protein implicated in regulation of membrane protease activity